LPLSLERRRATSATAARLAEEGADVVEADLSETAVQSVVDEILTHLSVRDDRIRRLGWLFLWLVASSCMRLWLTAAPSSVEATVRDTDVTLRDQPLAPIDERPAASSAARGKKR
jgi:hypothetical protein